MKKKLPIKQSPINAYMEDAYPITVALSDESSYEWIYSNYIQLVYQNPIFYCNQPLKFFKLSFLNGQIWDAECPLIYYDKINRNMLNSMGIDIVEFVCKAIEKNMYVKIYLDDYYLPYRPVYRKEHYIHESLFTGFDDEKKELYGLSYVTDDTGYHFKEFSINMNSIRQAYRIKEFLGVQRERIVLMSGNRERYYEFDIDVVRRAIEEYIMSFSTDERYAEINNPDTQKNFGLNIYSKLVDYYEQNEIDTTIIPLHILYEHKKLMLDRKMYMNDNQYIFYDRDLVDLCKDIIDISYKNKMLFLKYKMSRSNSEKGELSRIHLTQAIKKMKRQDEIFMKKFLEVLNHRKKNERIYSRWGWWKDISYTLGCKIYKKIRLSFVLNIINNRARGYIRITNTKGFENYNSPFIFRINTEKAEFGVADSNDQEYTVLKGIKCENNKWYKVIFYVDLITRRYSVIVSDAEHKIVYENEYDESNKQVLDYIDHFIAIHENSYRFSVTDIEVMKG